jgi:hypothetical protein
VKGDLRSNRSSWTRRGSFLAARRPDTAGVVARVTVFNAITNILADGTGFFIDAI